MAVEPRHPLPHRRRAGLVRLPGGRRQVRGQVHAVKTVGCRKCQRLAYASESEEACGRSWRAQQKVERKLGPDCAKPEADAPSHTRPAP